MAFGKLYTYEKNPRSTAIRAVAKANDLQLDVVEVDVTNPSSEYLKLNKLGKVPTFESEDGFVLYECMAIAIYSMSLPACLLLFGLSRNVMSFFFFLTKEKRNTLLSLAEYLLC